MVNCFFRWPENNKIGFGEQVDSSWAIVISFSSLLTVVSNSFKLLDSYILKSVPILYAVIVKLSQLMIEKKSFEEISLVYVSCIPSGFFDRSTLEEIEVLHQENEEEKFSFGKKLFYSHHNVHFLTHLVTLNSNILFPIKEDNFFGA